MLIKTRKDETNAWQYDCNVEVLKKTQIKHIYSVSPKNNLAPNYLNIFIEASGSLIFNFFLSGALNNTQPRDWSTH